MPSITVDAPSEEIDVTITLNDYMDYIDVEINDDQLCELVDDDPEMVLDHIWCDHPEAMREFVKNMDAGARLQLFAQAEKEEEKKKAEVAA